MMKCIILLALVCFAAVSELALARRSNLHEWTQYKKQHGKVYETPEEDSRRFAQFLATKERIKQHNADEQASHKLGLNHLSDWTPEERAKLNGYRYDPSRHMKRPEMPREDPFLKTILDDRPVPAEVDWRKVPNRVGPVKDQGQCGADWAFAATGVLEGQQVVMNFTKKLIPLSEQELVDCSWGNDGCISGATPIALVDLSLLGGIESEQDYPYKDKKTACTFHRSKSVMTTKGSVGFDTEEFLKKIVARFGPVATIMEAIESFFHYKSGIYSEPKCKHNSSGLNHEVLVVGYGTDPKEGDYWIVKNSYSAAWGEEGYFRIKQGVAMCGMGYMSTIPVFEDLVA